MSHIVMEELDELLKELDTGLLGPSSRKIVSKPIEITQVASQSSGSFFDKSESISSVDSHFIRLNPSVDSLTSILNLGSTSPFISDNRCDPLYVGGSGLERGGPYECCKNIRCRSCDHGVIQLSDHEWAPSANYLFLRNFYPKLDKLRTNLKYCPGSVAYCCQCSLYSSGRGDRLMKELFCSPSEGQGIWKCFGH